MSARLCCRCPRWHMDGEPCPPGFHDVRAEGGDGSGDGMPLSTVLALLVLALIVIGLGWVARS